MSFEFQCAHCGTLIEAQPEQRGETSDCPACHKAFIIPLSDLRAGETFAGFTLKKMLGTGTFGQVFLGIHNESGQRVALKIIPNVSAESDVEVSERFANEVAMMARITHPNVVPATQAGECGSYYFLAMEFIDGTNLEDRVETDGAMAEGEVLEIMMKVIDALTYAWGSHKIIHRDIKPANIMITFEGEVKLMDLGLSKSGYDGRDVLASESSFVGTPYYMSPEQVRSEEIDWRSDQYSLGATMFHLLTGQPPFDAETCQDLMEVIRDEETPRASQFASDISSGIDSLIGYLMAKDPEDRYDSWDQVIRAFREVHDGRDPSPPVKMAHMATTDGIKRSRMRNAGRNAGATTASGIPVSSLASGDYEAASSSGVTRGVGRGVNVRGGIGTTTTNVSVPLSNGKVADGKGSDGTATAALPAAGSEAKASTSAKGSWLLVAAAVAVLVILVIVGLRFIL